jgi:hypothetical protein
MIDDSRTLAIRLGKAQIEAMFARQDVAALDDSEFLPMLEAVLTAYEDVLGDAAAAEEIWEWAFAIYDCLCKEAQPASTTTDNRKLMRSYLLGRRGSKRQSQPTDRRLFRRREKSAVPRKEKPKRANPTQMCWTFGPDIPTEDFFGSRSLDNMHDLYEAVDSFIFWMEKDRFLLWEAVVCREQDIPLTRRQKNVLRELLDFSDEDDEPIYYIDEVPRFSQPWHVILNAIVPRLLIEPYRTFDIHDDVICDGWKRIVTVLREHGEGLSLPSDAQSAETVVPAELRHKLWLQSCFDALSGLGQDKSLTLTDPEQQYRIGWFIDSLRESKDSVAFLRLTLESLGAMVLLPAKDQPLFIALMKERLGLHSDREPIAGVL